MQVASLHIMGRGDGRPAVDGLHVQRELDGCIPGLGGHMVLQSSSGAPATAATGSVDYGSNAATHTAHCPPVWSLLVASASSSPVW